MKNFVSTKKIFVALLLVVSLMFLCNFALFSNLRTAEAYIYQSDSSDVSVENGDFVSNSVGNKNVPYSVANWDIKNKSSSVFAGVINVNKDVFNDNNSFGLDKNPETDEAISNADNYILMFRSNTAGRASAVSEEFSFTKNKFFRLDVHVKTTNGALASMYLSGGAGASFKNISTSDAWRTYSFYVASDFLNDLDSTLTLCFGGENSALFPTSGAAFFDHVKVYEISSIDFYSAAERANYWEKILDESRESSSPFLNCDFENGLENWKVEPLTGDAQATVLVADAREVNSRLNKAGESVDFASTNVFNGGKLLFIWNKNSAAKTKVTSEDWAVVSQHKFYALTFLLKTIDLSGAGVSVTLTPRDFDESKSSNDYSPLTVTGLTSTSTANAMNKFEWKTIYLRGSVKEDKEFSISFSLENSSGYAIIDQISLTALTQKEFSENATDSNSLNFASEVELSTISNSRFSLTDNKTIDEKYPLTPMDWNFSAEKNNAASGVVRVNPEKFSADKASFGYPENPGANVDIYRQDFGMKDFSAGANNLNENVLMVRNTSKSDAFFTSSAFSISASSSTLEGESASVVKISVGVKTLGDAKAFVKLLDSKGNVLMIFDNLVSKNWKMHNFYIRNGLSSLSEVKLVLGVYGSKNAGNNYAFFDDVTYSTVTNDQVLKGENSYYLDFVQQDFSSHSKKQLDSNVFEYPNFSVLSRTDSVSNYFGVTTEGSEKIFVINNLVEGFQTLISNYAYSLSSDKYYEVSVRVKTTKLFSDSFGGHFEVVALDSDGNIAQTDEENKNVFSNIITTASDDGWMKYTMYILCENSQNVKVVLGLGTEENEAQGKIFFDDLVFREVEKKTYAGMNEGPTTIVSATVQLPDEVEEDGGSSSESSDLGEVNIWALVSSILLVAALLLALAGYLIRQIPKKKVKKLSKKSNKYVVSIKKVKEQDIQRDLKIKREKDLSELKEELNAAQKEYDELQKKFNKDTADKDEVETRELYREFAKSANKAISRIEYLNSAIAYLNDPSIVRQTELREIRKRNRQNKLEFEREMQKEYEKISDDEVSEKTKKKRVRKKF